MQINLGGGSKICLFCWVDLAFILQKRHRFIHFMYVEAICKLNFMESESNVAKNGRNEILMDAAMRSVSFAIRHMLMSIL